MGSNTGFWIAAIIVVIVLVILLLRPLFRSKPPSTSWQTGPSPDAAPKELVESPPVPPQADTSTPFDEDHSLDEYIAKADKLIAARDYGSALDAFDDAIEKAREDLGPDDLRLADLLMRRGQADRGYNGSDYDEDTIPAEYLEALAITERRYGPMSELNLGALKELIAFYDHVGLHDKAAPLLYRVRDIEAAQAASAPQPPATA